MLTPPRFFQRQEDLPADAHINDVLQDALHELFVIQHPQYKELPTDSQEMQKFIAEASAKAVWVYYPQSKVAIHIPGEEHYFALRTARNRNIITEEEQANYRALRVGIAGLSVGSSILSTLVQGGGPKIIKITDFDVIAVSNLNRVNATLLDVETGKIQVAAKKIWELDPFAELELWDKGINTDNVQSFLVGKKKLNLFIDEMDNLALKVKARIICRQYGIPVLMATDNGDSVVLDVERFDTEQSRPLFHGIIENIENLDLENLTEAEWLSLAIKILDFSSSKKMRDSIDQIGKTIAAVPQLGATANMASVVIAYATRRIANNQRMSSGRYIINLEEILSS